MVWNQLSGVGVEQVRLVVFNVGAIGAEMLRGCYGAVTFRWCKDMCHDQM